MIDIRVSANNSFTVDAMVTVTISKREKSATNTAVTRKICVHYRWLLVHVTANISNGTTIDRPTLAWNSITEAAKGMITVSMINNLASDVANNTMKLFTQPNHRTSTLFKCQKNSTHLAENISASRHLILEIVATTFLAGTTMLPRVNVRHLYTQVVEEMLIGLSVKNNAKDNADDIEEPVCLVFSRPCSPL